MMFKTCLPGVSGGADFWGVALLGRSLLYAVAEEEIGLIKSRSVVVSFV